MLPRDVIPRAISGDCRVSAVETRMRADEAKPPRCLPGESSRKGVEINTHDQRLVPAQRLVLESLRALAGSLGTPVPEELGGILEDSEDQIGFLLEDRKRLRPEPKGDAGKVVV